MTEGALRVRTVASSGADAAALERLLGASFANGEPLTASGLTGVYAYALPRYFLTLQRTRELSVVAQGDGGELLGAALVSDLATEEGAKLDEHPPAVVEAAFADLERFALRYHCGVTVPPPSGTVAHLMMLAVAANGRGRGVAGALSSRIVDEARALGYSFMLAEVTGAYSAHALAQLGFERIAAVPYSRWVDPTTGLRYVKELPPHTEMACVLKRL
eukprot:TRINITY_DN17524_c0_g1_i1.p1 TRINITY_DN17524_c0_g1~~TRINITY_DN17524_c0_g1_i1.p1  ORF type:complete len:217 (-),score=61.57 TRINITY_DN17524_c0_g1_i1:71-721(-)